MATAVRISDDLIKSARKVSKVENRSLTGQIEYWAKIGQIAEENPELSFKLIKEILLGLEDIEAGEFSEYQLNEPG
ncbi:MAG TPA: ParD-like family protein [Bacteroidales bacterium]|nr:ParD-like family protein [Bacteroidales bacterium]